MMKEMLRELVEYRHLVYILTWRDIKIKYKQTVMGFLWAILMPLLIVAAGIIVKKAFAMVSGKPVGAGEIASITVKALPWSFFIGSIRFATGSLVGNSNLVTKIYFPREVFPIAAVLGNLFDFAIASVALAAILGVSGLPVSPNVLWVIPLLVILILLTMGLGLLLSCANLFFRDVKYIVEVVVTFAIFFTPVFYEASLFGRWEPVLLANPVGAILEMIDRVVVRGRPPIAFWTGYAAAWSLATFLFSWALFHRSEAYFAENI